MSKQIKHQSLNSIMDKYFEDQPLNYRCISCTLDLSDRGSSTESSFTHLGVLQNPLLIFYLTL